MWSPRLCVREDMAVSDKFMIVVHREFHIDVGVMFDSLRPIPASFGRRKRRTKGPKGNCFLESWYAQKRQATSTGAHLTINKRMWV